MNPSPPELFPQRPVRSDFGRAPSYRTRRIITVLVCLVLIGGILYRVMGRSSTPPGEIPTIKAETGNWKQRPEQPGGIDIPHQDVEVYQALDGKDTGAKPPVEHLLPPPETPQPAASNANASPQPAAPSQPENLTQQSPASIAPAPAPAPVPAPVATTVEPQPPQPVQAVPIAAPASVPATTTKPDAMAQVLKDTVKSGKTIRVQLASVPDETSANQMMKQLENRYASVLGDAHLHLVRADLGDKGIYYRIQSQPVSEDRASNICAALKKMKAGCILVR